jgi:hypothetical protein
MSLNSELAKKQQIKEILKCGRDPIYFLNNYVKIQHPTKGLLPFKTYPFQDDCLNMFMNNRLNICCKSRQLGLSTVTAAYAVWMAIFHKDKNILVIATKLPTAINMIDKVKVVLNNLPEWLLLPKFEPSKQQVTFNNGSKIKAIPTSPDAGRSEALSLLIIDECAHIDDFDDIWTGLQPTVSTGGDVILISSPNGVGGTYHDLWVEAEAGVNGFNPIKLMWDVHPERDRAWFVQETKSLSRKKIAQEYECSFIASGDTFLQADDLENIKKHTLIPIAKAGNDRNVWIWSEPIPDREYLLSADVSRGDAKDYSAFHIIDKIDCSVVAEYMGKIPPEKLADLIMFWASKYNEAFVVVEQNTFGYLTNVKIRDLGYKNLFYEKKYKVSKETGPKQTDIPGFITTSKNRLTMLSKLEETLRNRLIKTYSSRLYDQLLTFIWNGNRPESTKDGYDDLIMSLAIGVWLTLGESTVQTTNDDDMQRAILKAMSVTKNSLYKDQVQVANNAIMTTKTIAHPKIANSSLPKELSNMSWLFK